MSGINFETSEFRDEVYAAVQSVQRGDVVTYGDIAVIMGRDSSANGMAIGQALRPLTIDHWDQVPWHRVVLGTGQLVTSSGDPDVTSLWAEKLQSEGVDVHQVGPDYFVTKIARGEYIPRSGGTAKKSAVKATTGKTIPCERHYRDGAVNDGAQQMCPYCL